MACNLKNEKREIGSSPFYRPLWCWHELSGLTFNAYHSPMWGMMISFLRWDWRKRNVTCVAMTLANILSQYPSYSWKIAEMRRIGHVPQIAFFISIRLIVYSENRIPSRTVMEMVRQHFCMLLWARTSRDDIPWRSGLSEHSHSNYVQIPAPTT